MKLEDKEISIPVHYVSIGVLNRQWNFPYSDDCFLSSSDEYNHKLAQASLGLAVSADRDQSFSLEEQNKGVESFFSTAGFGNPKYFLYDVKSKENTVACAVASKKIEDFTLVAVTVCGNGYGAEWKGNFTVGTGERHLGFSLGAELVKNNIREYLKEAGIEGKSKLWCAAYSRGAAVLNLVAYDLMRDGVFNELFAYLYASPSVTKQPSSLAGMFNIVRENDPFAMLPGKKWGYGRYGTQLYISSDDGDSDIAQKLGCRNFKPNYVISDDFKKVYSYLDILFPTAESYENAVPVIYSIYDNPSLKNILANYKYHRAFKQKFNSEQRKTYRILKRFLFKRIVFFKKYVRKQIRTGVWDKNSRLDTNIFKEHSGDMYVIGMFSSSGKILT